MRGHLHRNAGGFTLTEVLVLIVIIGVLAGIAIPVFLSERKKAFEASEKSDARWIATEMESYFADARACPAALPLTGSHIVFATVDQLRTHQPGRLSQPSRTPPPAPMSSTGQMSAHPIRFHSPQEVPCSSSAPVR